MEYDEDSLEHRWREAKFWPSYLSSFPTLRSYDLEEGRAWGKKSKEEFEKKGDDYLEEDGVWGNPRLYVPLRFFESLLAFHEGSLDLSGRHASRYIRLVEKFKLLSDDYVILYAQCTPFTYIEPDFRGEPTEYQDYKFEDETLWPTFAKKWRIAKWWGCSLVFSWIKRVVEIIGKHPKPVFQLLCLHHLPVELISRVFDFTTQEDARLLSSTSHQMRSIGLKDIFSVLPPLKYASPHFSRVTNQVRNLKLQPKFDEDWRTPYSDADIHERFLKRQESLLSTIDFLLSRGDLIRAMEKLILTDGTKLTYAFPRSVEQYLEAAGEMADFYEPIQRGFEKVLMTANTLSELGFAFLVILPAFVHPISCMLALHTISFHICSVPAELAEMVATGELPKVMTVRNLSVFMDASDEDEDDHCTSWYLIPLFSGLHNVAIKSTKIIDLPSNTIVDSLNHFQDVERFIVHELHPRGTRLFTHWISNSIQFVTAIPLTHFKFHSRWHMDDHELFELIAILRNAESLQALSFDGILYAEPDLLERLAEAAPNLISLTLVKRHNERQHQAKGCPWPQSSGRYAERLGLFPRLRYFGWNDTYPSYVPTTSIILNFEDGFPDPESPGYWERARELESDFLDGYLTTAIFAIYSPTLRAVSWLDDRFDKTDFITRKSDGTMDLEASLKYRGYDMFYELARKWNPSSWDGSWPRTVPEGTTEDW